MKYYIVLWIDYKMPGGLFGSFIPDHLRPFLGQAEPQGKVFTKMENACRHIRDVGLSASPKLYWCENLKWRERDIDFNVTAQIEGEGS